MLFKAALLGFALAAAPQAQPLQTPQAPNQAQNQAQPAAPDAVAGVPESEAWATPVVIVQARFPGPAIWRIHKGNSEVYILGAMPVMIKRYDWDKGRIGRILDKANVLLLSPRATIGPVSLIDIQLSKGAGLFRTAYGEMPADVAQRFKALAVQNGLNPDTYAKSTPVYAAMQLRADIYAKHNLSTTDPEKMLVFMARDRHTPMKPMATYSASSVIGKLKQLSPAERTACVSRTLDEISFALGHIQAATDAWAHADLNGVHANAPGDATLDCLEGSASTRALLDRATSDAVKAVDAALDQPGKSVVVFPLDVLMRPNGALQTLKDQGADVGVPEDAN